MSTIKVDTLQTRAGSTAAVTGAGSLKVDNLRGNTATASITLGDGSNTLGALSTAGAVTITGEGGTVTTNLQQGLAKVWMQATSASSVSIQDSFNVASLADTSAGAITPSFTNDMSTTAYSLTFGQGQFHSSLDTGGAGAITTGSYKHTTSNSSHAATDSAGQCSTLHGDLA